MANPQQISYSNSMQLHVSSVDNRLIGILAPDTSGTGGKRTQVFAYDCDGFGGCADTTIDLTCTLERIGGNPTLVMIGSNFRGGGTIQFTLTPDGDASKAVTVNANPASFSSQQWAYDLIKA